MTTHSIDSLRRVITNRFNWREPWISGTICLSDSESKLFFTQKDGTSRCVDLRSTTKEEAEILVDACRPAPFGRGEDSVLDETYRKAGVLDVAKFAWNFNSDTLDITSRLVKGLFPWATLDKGIRLEMHKLNVYEHGSFFKPHKDTPRSEDMFGSLVIVLPFNHQSGNLVLRHNGKEFNFDAPSLLRDAAPGTIAYTAFYSDVEHEVLEVTSGNRVTITYNLFYDETFPSLSTPGVPPTPDPVRLAFVDCLGQDAFKKDNRYLGFGLQHSYPMNAKKYEANNLRGKLKGLDAALYRILTDLGHKPKIMFLYSAGDYYGFKFITDHPVDQYHVSKEESDFGDVINSSRASLVKPKGTKLDLDVISEWEKQPEVIEISWVTEPTDNLLGRSVVVTYGNEASADLYYFRACLVVDLAFEAKPVSVPSHSDEEDSDEED